MSTTSAPLATGEPPVGQDENRAQAHVAGAESAAGAGAAAAAKSGASEAEMKEHSKKEEEKEKEEGEDVVGQQAETASQSDSLTDAIGASVSGDTTEDEDDAGAASSAAGDRGPPTFARSIVIGVDGSAQSYHAFHWYISNMHMDGNFVVLVHAFELPLLHSFQEMYVAPEMWEATLKREAKNTTNMKKRLRGVMNRCRIPGKFVARGGRPGEVIVAVAEEEDADMVLVGTRGHGKLRRAIMGSVSGYVAHHAPCAVTICRQKNRKRTDSGSSFTSTGSGSYPRLDVGPSPPRGRRPRCDSGSSTGSMGSHASRGSRGSHVRFDMSGCPGEESSNGSSCERSGGSTGGGPVRRVRYHSTGSTDEIPAARTTSSSSSSAQKTKKPSSLFRSIISRKRSKSEGASLDEKLLSSSVSSSSEPSSKVEGETTSQGSECTEQLLPAHTAT